MILRSWCYIFLIFYVCDKSIPINKNTIKSHAYYFSSNGDDKNDGSFHHPFKTIGHFNSIKFNPGDSIFFKGGEIFKGNLIFDSTKSGINEKPVVIASYGNGNAIIDAANGTAIAFYNSCYVNINNLTLKGVGRKEGNTKEGIAITNFNDISIDQRKGRI